MYQGQQRTEYFHSTISETDVWSKQNSNQLNLYLTQGINSYQHTKVLVVRNILQGMPVPLIASLFKSLLALYMFPFPSTNSFFYICTLPKSIIKIQLDLKMQSYALVKQNNKNIAAFHVFRHLPCQKKTSKKIIGTVT